MIKNLYCFFAQKGSTFILNYMGVGGKGRSGKEDLSNWNQLKNIEIS